MNFFKATIATAAVITCCMGNEYPAQAKDADAFDQGYASGYVINSCIMYSEGIISQARFVEDVQRAQKYLSDWQADGLITGFRDGANSDGPEAAKRAFRECYSDSKHLIKNFNSSYGSRI